MTSHPPRPDPRATRISPWQDNLRHMYEAGRSIQDLAYWFTSKDSYTMRRLLVQAGTVIRKQGRPRRQDRMP